MIVFVGCAGLLEPKKSTERVLYVVLYSTLQYDTEQEHARFCTIEKR
jgi:hypothetical protein